MDGRSFLRRKDREALRERWWLRAGQTFERMFGEANQGQLITFTEIPWGLQFVSCTGFPTFLGRSMPFRYRKMQ